MPHFSSQFFTKNLCQNFLIIFNSFPPADRYCELARISRDPFHVNEEVKMKRKFYESTHEEALDRLCFICGEMINLEKYFYDVEKSLDLIAVALKCPDIFTMPGVTPYHMCQTCYTTLQRLKSGDILKSSRQLLDWEECSDNCGTCTKILKRKQGGGRRKKVSRVYIIIKIHLTGREYISFMKIMCVSYGKRLCRNQCPNFITEIHVRKFLVFPNISNISFNLRAFLVLGYLYQTFETF